LKNGLGVGVVVDHVIHAWQHATGVDHGHSH
jgi:hypothetical protein